MARTAAAVLVLLGAAALGASLPEARGQEGAPPPAEAPDAAARARRIVKARRLLEASRWLDQAKAGITGSLEEREAAGWMPAGTTASFKETADWNGLLDLAAAAWASELDEEALDAGILFYESDPGKRLAAAQPRLAVGGASFLRAWTAATLAKAAAGSGEGGLGAKAKGLLGRLKGGGKPEDNEAAAAAALRRIAEGQAAFRASGALDADGDGAGEFGTLLELSGAAGLRRGLREAAEGYAPGSDFADQGPRAPKPFLDPEFGKVDGNGILEREGYLLLVLLPDDRAAAAGFVHETGPAEAPALAGDSMRAGIDLSERTWCAYAWPKERGRTGTRAFFVGGDGTVLRSDNAAARWSGADRPPKPSSAFLGAGITSRPAVGTLGRDGDVWKPY